MMRCLMRDGCAMHLREDGDPSGAPLLLINSLGTDLRIWDPLISHLPAGLRLLRYDKRGHGLTDAPAAPYAMETLVEDALAALDAFGVEKTMVVGLSIGGVIALGMALSAPERLNAMVLLDTGAKIGATEIWNERIAAVENEGLASLIDAIMQRWFTADFLDNAPEAPIWRNMVLRTTDAGYAGCCAALRDIDYTDRLGEIRTPTLCVVGAEDPSTPPAILRSNAEAIAGAGYVEIPGAAHLPNVQKPEALAAVLGPFLQEHARV